jgi:hypothetical protein
MMKHFCDTISVLLSDYLNRTLDAIFYNALEQFSAKNPHLADPDSLKQFGDSVRTFVVDAIELRKLCVRMSYIVDETGTADYLTKLSHHPFCAAALRRMGCDTGAIGGRMTAAKRWFMQKTWKGNKLYTFFSTLEEDLREQFRHFCMPSKTEMDNRAEVSQMILNAIEDPNFGKPEPSDVRKVVDEIMILVKLDFLQKCQNVHVPSHQPSIPPNA